MMPHRPQAAPPRQPREHGFTLIELLVSLTLMALIAVVLSGGLRFGASVWRAGALMARLPKRLGSSLHIPRWIAGPETRERGS